MITRHYLMLMAAMVVSVAAFAASDSDSLPVHRVELEAVPGLILHTNRFLEGNNPEVRTMNHSFVARLKYAFMPPVGSRQARIYKGSYQGVGVAFHDFNPQLGHPVSAYLFQGATIKTLSRCLSLDYEWDFGLTYGWKPYHRENHPDNHVIGSKMTAYMDVDCYLRWRLSDQWDVNLGATLTHYSNGNTSIPNAGLNVLGAKLSLAYYFNRQEDVGDKAGPLPPFQRSWHTDVTLYGAWKKKGVDTSEGSYAIPGTFGVMGLHVNPMYGLNHWLNLGASLDAQYDHSSNISLDEEALTMPYWNGTEANIHIPSWHRQVAVGLSARAEFVMPYFTINFGVGHNIVNAGATDFRRFYEVLALKIAMSRRSYLHIGYSIYDFRYPNNLMLGAGYRIPWKNKRNK